VCLYILIKIDYANISMFVIIVNYEYSNGPYLQRLQQK